MNLYTTTEVLDIQHDICHCVAEVIGKTPLGSMEFSRIFTYQPDRSFIARRCGTKAYIKSIHIDSIHSDAAHELFDNFRKTAVNEFLFSSKVPRPMQHAIVAEFGYPVIAPELLPLLEMTRDLRYEGASYDEKSLSSDFIRWITSIEQLDFFYKNLLAPVTFHIASSSFRINRTEFAKSQKDCQTVRKLLAEMDAVPVPMLDCKDGQFYISHGCISFLSAYALGKLTKEISQSFAEFNARISFQQAVAE